ncbi:TetR/AcrR family transcriptional regulator [Deefgea rivuli]|uniref:TetR/AcrR family transcriptional regulator n=1 Tax=Deefgea rivuli TaxID=400948 RepID=UPI00048293DA|nr:TetR/AcrR family transcriptional regulator [Deefgea rivuli]
MAKLADKQELVDVATALFRQKGYSATSVSDIVAACGISKGSLYHHFDSKEALAVAALNRVSEYFRRELFSLVLDAPQAGAAELAAFNQAVEVFFSQHPDGCLLANLSLELAAPTSLFQPCIQAFFAQWAEVYACVFRPLYPEQQAQQMADDALASVHGGILLQRIRGSMASLQRQHAHLLQLATGTHNELC